MGRSRDGELLESGCAGLPNLNMNPLTGGFARCCFVALSNNTPISCCFANDTTTSHDTLDLDLTRHDAKTNHLND